MPVLNARCLVWNASLFSVPRGRGADVAPEEAREVALIRKAGCRRDGRERLVGTRELGCRPGQAEAAAVLADREAVASAEHAGEVRRVNADRLGQLGQTDAIAQAGAPEKRLAFGSPSGPSFWCYERVPGCTERSGGKSASRSAASTW
jgi:hypothetical protein